MEQFLKNILQELKKAVLWIRNYFETLVWSIALIALYFMDVSSAHFSLCPFHNLGFSFCPGCGLGHSLHYLMHFDLQASLAAHPLGIFAFVVLVHRIIILFVPKQIFKTIKPQNQ